mmetsp:Transcript_45541/g.88985  ORF Transcript_45541/g.88985 Transcript_45541/m.88985 type:complete len:214 (-) Transcript_45541:188-829(-)
MQRYRTHSRNSLVDRVSPFPSTALALSKACMQHGRRRHHIRRPTPPGCFRSNSSDTHRSSSARRTAPPSSGQRRCHAAFRRLLPRGVFSPYGAKCLRNSARAREAIPQTDPVPFGLDLPGPGGSAVDRCNPGGAAWCRPSFLEPVNSKPTGVLASSSALRKYLHHSAIVAIPRPSESISLNILSAASSVPTPSLGCTSAARPFPSSVPSRKRT